QSAVSGPGSGRLLLAVVVPLRQVLRVRAGNGRAQVLAVSGPTFEEQLASLVSNAAPAAGLGSVAIANDPMPVRDAEEAELVSELRNLAQSVSSSRSIERRQLRLTYLSGLPAQQDGWPAVSPTRTPQVTYYGPDIAKVFVFGKWHPMPRQLCAYGDAGVARWAPRVPAKPWLPSLAAIRDVLAARRQTWPRPLQLRPALTGIATGDNYIGEHRDKRARTSTPLRPYPLMGEKRAAGAGRLQPAGDCNAPTNSHWTLHSLPKRKRARHPSRDNYQVFAPELAWRQVFLRPRRHPRRRDGPGQNSAESVAFLLGLHGGRRRGGRQRPLPESSPCGATPATRREECLRGRAAAGDWTLLLLHLMQLCLKDEEFFRANFHSTPWCRRGSSITRIRTRSCTRGTAGSQCQLPLHPDRTPIQNNLDELFTLLSFVAPKVFRLKFRALYEILKPFPAAPHQRGHAFDTATGNKTRLLNIQMQLRKCINHPYLFDGVEPEPFQPGEHLVTASAKLILIDRLLKYLKANGHKASRNERLDGSVRGEEALPGAVKNFNQTAETFVFLLSTRAAAGSGLNLVSADTVIFVDSATSIRQNDLQAAARVQHRIGQTRNVKIIRLAGKNTIEEIILRRAETKLALTKQVIGHGKFSLGFDDADKAKEADASKQSNREVAGSGLSPRNRLRLVNRVSASNAVASATSAAAAEEEAAATHMYMWEGKDYSSGAANIDQLEAKDETALQALLTDLRVKETAEAGAGRGLRGQQASGALTQLPDAASSRRQARRPLTEAEKVERRAKREAAAAAAPPRRRRRCDAGRSAVRRSGARPASTRRIRFAMATDSSDEEAADDEPRGVGDIGEDKRSRAELRHRGRRRAAGGPGGRRRHRLPVGRRRRALAGSGGVFAALDAAWPKSGVGAAYEAASAVGRPAAGRFTPAAAGQAARWRDLLRPAGCPGLQPPGPANRWRALSSRPAQRPSAASPNRPPRRARPDAVASVPQHLPRLGHGLSAGLGWYGVERNLQKLLARRGVPAFQRQPEINDESAEESEAEVAAAAPEPKRPRLALGRHFHRLPGRPGRRPAGGGRDQLARYLLAYDADVQLTVPAGAAAAAPQGQLDFLVTLLDTGDGRGPGGAIAVPGVGARLRGGRALPSCGGFFSQSGCLRLYF
uniref:SNF2_N domain-containing protein n=1 Tax=Macrostomum lignano TaxID=282301 RepID=A0A1I8F6H7_9PLAT